VSTWSLAPDPKTTNGHPPPKRKVAVSLRRRSLDRPIELELPEFMESVWPLPHDGRIRDPSENDE